MTKADIVSEISDKTGIEKIIVQTTIEAFMKSIRSSMSDGKNVYLRGFGTFLVKKRAEKIGRNISKNTTVVIPAHYIP
ncbi:MAG: HU family DNA-binding protein, partial [Bacteroidota bacterium]